MARGWVNNAAFSREHIAAAELDGRKFKEISRFQRHLSRFSISTTLFTRGGSFSVVLGDQTGELCFVVLCPGYFVQFSSFLGHCSFLEIEVETLRNTGIQASLLTVTRDQELRGFCTLMRPNFGAESSSAPWDQMDIFSIRKWRIPRTNRPEDNTHSNAKHLYIPWCFRKLVLILLMGTINCLVRDMFSLFQLFLLLFHRVLTAPFNAALWVVPYFLMTRESVHVFFKWNWIDKFNLQGDHLVLLLRCSLFK